jgi:parallel beta-helix repeat protein
MIMSRILFLAPAVLAVGMAHAQSSPTLWGPHVDVEAKPGSKRTLGEADLFLPLSQDARTLVFGNLRTRFDNQNSYEGNLGIGVRRMYDSGWNLGAYGYVDRRRSETGQYYNQTTLGAEALGPDLDFRANAYVPHGDRVRTLGTTVTDGGPSTAALVGTVIQVTTPGSTTSTREERSLEGYDLEAGWRLPLFDRIDRRQLRLYIGSYRFHDSVTTVSGPRLRAEFALTDLPQLWRGAELLFGAEAQHDSVRGSQNFLSVRLRIPLGKTEERSRQLTWQERRMTAPVVRDVDVVTNARTVSTTAAAQVETATATAGNQNITVLNSTTTPGTTLQAALNGAGPNSTVILSGTFDLGNGNATLQTGQTVMGRGSITVRTPSGRVATLTASQGATISSSIQLNTVGAVIMADNSTLTGMTIVRNQTFGSERGVEVINVSNVTLANNTISVATTSGVPMGVYIDGSSNVRVTGNTISSTRGAGAAIGLYMKDSSIVVSNNTLSAFGPPSYAAFLTTTAGHTLTLQSGSSGNVFANGSCFNAGGAGIIGGSLSYTVGSIPGTCP